MLELGVAQICPRVGMDTPGLEEVNIELAEVGKNKRSDYTVGKYMIPMPNPKWDKSASEGHFRV